MSNNIVVKNGKELRRGYTTGSCATAASAAAFIMALKDTQCKEIKIILPSGDKVPFEIHDIEYTDGFAKCSVTKDAGDDPDATHGMSIFASVRLTDNTDIIIDGGEGIGRVTTRGLKCEVGQAAINPVPRHMITENLRQLMNEYGYTGGVEVIISAPKGEEVAKHTFNARLGIIGGISILGTTGIVEPMSEQALVDTIKILIDKHRAEGNEDILIAPGNYGRDYCESSLFINIDKAIKISNYMGETLDYLCYKGYKRVLLVGHSGKLVKLAGGIMNTHSSYADCRMEIISAHTALCGGDSELIKRLMKSITTDEAIRELKESGLSDAVWSSIIEKICFQLDYRTKGKLKTEVIIFGGENEAIAMSEGALKLAKIFREDK